MEFFNIAKIAEFIVPPGNLLFLAVIAALGLPPGAVAFAALAFIVQDFFTHANLRVPQPVDRLLRMLMITPAMHRVHHSREVREQNTNFGTVFSVWDKLFGTYSVGLAEGMQPPNNGLAEITKGSDLSGAGLLILPFRRLPKDNP